MVDLKSLANKRTAILVVAGLFIVFSYSMLSSTENNSAEEYMDQQGFISEGLDNYSITSEESRKVSNVKIDELTLTEGEREIRIKILSDGGEAFAKNYLEDRRNEIISMYTNTPSPYDAVPEREVNCPEDLKPTIDEENRSGINYTYYNLYADERKIIGVCSEDKIHYSVEKVAVYCPEQDKVLEASIYQPQEADNPVSPIKDIRCAD